jgi:hypothetical protein
MALAADNAADRVEQLIILTERLTELIAAQAQAFEQHKPQEAASYLEETSKLANIYRHESAKIRANPALLSDAPVAERTRLTRATEAFDAVLARQARALEAGKKVTEGLVRAIAEEVASQRGRAAPVAYTASGQRSQAPVDGSAITLNRRA